MMHSNTQHICNLHRYNTHTWQSQSKGEKMYQHSHLWVLYVTLSPLLRSVCVLIPPYSVGPFCSHSHFHRSWPLPPNPPIQHHNGRLFVHTRCALSMCVCVGRRRGPLSQTQINLPLIQTESRLERLLSSPLNCLSLQVRARATVQQRGADRTVAHTLTDATHWPWRWANRRSTASFGQEG